MKQYQFKIQWLFTFENFKKFVEVIGVGGLDKIIIRDNDLKILNTYKGFVSYPTGFDGSQTIEENIKRNYYNVIGDNFYVEVIKKWEAQYFYLLWLLEMQ